MKKQRSPEDRMRIAQASITYLIDFKRSEHSDKVIRAHGSDWFKAFAEIADRNMKSFDLPIGRANSYQQPMTYFEKKKRKAFFLC